MHDPRLLDRSTLLGHVLVLKLEAAPVSNGNGGISALRVLGPYIGWASLQVRYC